MSWSRSSTHNIFKNKKVRIKKLYIDLSLSLYFCICQLAFTRDGLYGLWNEMVKDGEIVYTGTELTQNRELPSRKGKNF